MTIKSSVTYCRVLNSRTVPYSVRATSHFPPSKPTRVFLSHLPTKVITPPDGFPCVMSLSGRSPTREIRVSLRLISSPLQNPPHSRIVHSRRTHFPIRCCNIFQECARILKSDDCGRASWSGESSWQLVNKGPLSTSSGDGMDWQFDINQSSA